MKQLLLYLGSGLMTVLVGYLTNQLPNLPDNLKPWVPLALSILTLIASVMLIQQSNSGATSYKTVINRNRLKGKNTSIKATDALVDQNTLEGDDASISTNDRDPGQQP